MVLLLSNVVKLIDVSRGACNFFTSFRAVIRAVVSVGEIGFGEVTFFLEKFDFLRRRAGII